MEEELQKLHPPRPPRQPDLEPRSRRGLVGVIPEGPGHGKEEESDSDGPVPYRDEDDEDEDEDVPVGKTDPRRDPDLRGPADPHSGFLVPGGLASRVRRKDTLALRLERQEAQENQGSLSWSSREQWEEMRNRIGTTLTR